MKVVFALGDSITYGCWGQETRGWTTLLREYLESQEPYPSYYLYTLGIPGETSSGLRKRFVQEIDARKRSDDSSYVYLVACGANDATWLNGDQRFKQSKDEYAENMRTIFSELKNRPGVVYALNITPVNEEFSKEFKGKDKSCLNEYVDAYNHVLAQVSSELEVEIIDVNAAFRNNDFTALFTDDGLHPNDDGHRLIFETVKNYTTK